MFAYLAGLALQLADRGMNLIITERAYRLIKAQLIIAHAGAAMGEMTGIQLIGKLQTTGDDHVAIRAQHRVLLVHARARPQQRHDELVPQRLPDVQFMMFDRAELQCPVADPLFLFVIDTAAVDKGGVYRKALFAQSQHAIAGIHAA